ncbi:MAG: class I SAM-dependent methyltransferase [Sediminibacterium sp.]|jgi:O-methyltransferase|nr:class I SAM-dependent methyltransferase [Sediminibacterium sp.]MBX9781179.1 TylF/MycF family methyltransferase [Chitinophagaceae bacterium]
MTFKPIKAFRVLFGIENTISAYPSDFELFHQEIINKVRPYTMTSSERLYGLIEAVKYIVKHNINGDFVECGVWKGGSAMAIAETLLSLGVTDRKIWLYDTFEGMTAPTKDDIDILNRDAGQQLTEQIADKNSSIVWAYSSLEEVKANFAKTNYPQNNIHFIKGDILQTVPSNAPAQIALLRLDTDWYESTAHEMTHLYPLLTQEGVLIIDDYGFWKGSKKAVDEYFEKKKERILLHRMDETGRIAIKSY